LLVEEISNTAEASGEVVPIPTWAKILKVKKNVRSIKYFSMV
jgi:hypothetical protein